jgi:hypothetical protein
MKKIFFSASFLAMPEMINSYTDVIKAIQKNGGYISVDWTKSFNKKKLAKISKEAMEKNVDHNKFFGEHARAIEESEILVAEVSKPSLGVGYQIFYATHLKKPVLALYSDDIENIEEIHSIINMDSKFVTLKKYNKKSLEHIVGSFINKREENLKKFNFIISDEIELYLEWLEVENKNKSKSELLRNKIIDEIILRDKKYLKHKSKK